MKPAADMHHPKVLIIGLDGATFDLIKPWAAAGKLPTFAQLLQDGVHGALESTIPPITPPAWTSFMTGVNPGKHGLFNFTQYNPKDHSIQYTNASYRSAPTIWKLLSSMGCKVGVMNVPMTYPPEHVNGFYISGLDTPHKNSAFVYPSALKEEIERTIGEIYLDPRHLGYMKTDDKRDETLASLAIIENRRTDIADYLLKQHPVDVMMLVYTATDTVQHFFWNYMGPTHPFYDPVGAEKYRDAILQIYCALDANIAQLLKGLAEDTVVIVASDHGGGPVSSKVLHLNQHLEELGVLAYKNGRRGAPRRALHRLVSGLDGYLRAMLSPAQKATLAKMLPSFREKWESYATALTMIDWAKTQAYCLEFLAFPSEIWINLEGRTPHGRVKPGVEYDQLIEHLRQQLSTLQDPSTGRRLIRRVYRKEEIYQGPFLHLAPDLVFSWWDEGGLEARKSVPGTTQPSLRDNRPGDETPSAAWSGTHRLHGILVLHGGPFRRGATLTSAHITDIAPTLFYLLGMPVPRQMDGKVLLEAFQAEYAAARPVQYQDAGSPAAGGASSEAAYTAEESDAIQERLKGLGYID